MFLNKMLARRSLLQAYSSHHWGLRVSKNSGDIYKDRSFFSGFVRKN